MNKKAVSVDEERTGPNRGPGYWKTLGLFGRDVRLLLGSTALMSLALGIYSVIFNLYLLRLAYTASFVGLTRAVGSLCFAGFGLVAGLLGQRFSSRRVLIAGASLLAVAFALIGAAALLPVRLRSGWLLVSNTLGWIGYATFFVNSGPFLMQHTAEVERSHAFSVSATVHPLMGFVGGLLGGLLPGFLARAMRLPAGLPATYGYTLWVAGAVTLVAIPALVLTRPTGVRQARTAGPRSAVVPLGVIGFLTLFGFFRGAGEHAVNAFFNVYLDLELGASTAQIGVLFAVAQLVAVPAALAYPWFARRSGNFRTVVAGVVAISVALLPLVLVPHWAPAAVGFAGAIAAATIVNTAVLVYSQGVVKSEWRSLISGALSMANGFGIAATSLGGSAIIGALGYRSFFGVSAALPLGAVVIFWGYFHVPRGEFARLAGEPGPLQPEAVTGTADSARALGAGRSR
jgi:MFS family permease